MWQFVSISLALIIHFTSQAIKGKNPNHILQIEKQNEKSRRGFPYQYFKGKILTDEMVQF